MTTEYEEALGEMNEILQQENEHLLAKVELLKEELQKIRDAGSEPAGLRIHKINGRGNFFYAISDHDLIEFYKRGQYALTRILKERRIPDSPSKLLNDYGIDLKFGMQELENDEYDYNRKTYVDKMQNRYTQSYVPISDHYRYDDFNTKP